MIELLGVTELRFWQLVVTIVVVRLLAAWIAYAWRRRRRLREYGSEDRPVRYREHQVRRWYVEIQGRNGNWRALERGEDE